MKNFGFTLIELMVVIGLVGIIMTFSTVNLVSLRNKSSLNSMVTQLVADLKQQQMKAMIGNASAPDIFGVHFTSNSYALFQGTATDPNKFVIKLDPDLSLSYDHQDLIFKKLSGERATVSLTNLKIKNNNSGEEKEIKINEFGVITEVKNL